MSTVKLSQEPKTKRRSAKASESRKICKHDDPLDLFPLPRYFQIHFQHMHENNDGVQAELGHLDKRLTNIESKLDKLLTLLKQCSECGH